MSRTPVFSKTADADYRTPCINLLINGAIRNSRTPAPASSQKLKVKPCSADCTVMPVSPLTSPAKMPERLLPIAVDRNQPPMARPTRSEEHTSELQSLMRISYAVFCLKKKKKQQRNTKHHI